MKRSGWSLILVFLCLMLAGSVYAQVTAVPQLMNFQGRLAKPDGTPVADGNYSLRFSLWTAASGGTEKWNQTLNPVSVRNGTFAVLLNTSTGATDKFNGNLWLEIKIGTDVPLTPRQQLVSVAYAIKANTVPDGSIGASQIANGSITNNKLAAGTLNSLSWLLGGNSGTNSASNFLGTTDNQSLVFRTNNTEKVRLLANGNLGVGNTAPSHRLTVTSTDASTLRLIGPGATYGFESKLNFGDSDYTYIQEDTDDSLRIHARLRTAITGGNLGVGTTSPQQMLSVGGGANIDQAETNIGTLANALTFGSGSGEGIGSNRHEGGANLHGLDIYTGYLNRMSITNGGLVGIGTSAPAVKLDVVGEVQANGTATVGNYGYLGGPDYGVFGSSTTKYGIRGEISGAASSGGWAGVSGKDNVSGNFGQLGTSSYGVSARSVISNGVGIYGEVTHASGYAGMKGMHTATGNIGLLGYQSAGVFGSSSGGSVGVEGQSLSGYGVAGVSSTGFGVYGISSDGFGIRGISTNSDGVYGTSWNANGVVGLSSDHIGVQGSSNYSYGVQGLSAYSAGVYGSSYNNQAAGVHGYGGVNNVAVFAGNLSTFGHAAFQSNLSTGSGTNHIVCANNGAPVFYVNGSGLTFANGGYLSSDARYKTNIATFENALDTILNLRGVTFDWKRNDWMDKSFPEGRQIGFIAQEVEKVLPELVSTDSNGYKSVAYANLVPVLVEAVKHQQAQSQAQQRQIEALQTENKRITTLEARLAAQQAQIEELKRRLDALPPK